MGLTYRDMEDEGWFMVVSSASCRFRAPARYDDVLEIETVVARLTHTRIDHTYRILRRDDRLLLAEAETTLACVDREGIVQAIPPKVKEAIEQQA
jgi:acyl-CoA thioester hydrolase